MKRSGLWLACLPAAALLLLLLAPLARLALEGFIGELGPTAAAALFKLGKTTTCAGG